MAALIKVAELGQSSNLHTALYDPHDMTLYASFNHNPDIVYAYPTDEDTVNAIRTAPSIGKAFNQLINKKVFTKLENSGDIMEIAQ